MKNLLSQIKLFSEKKKNKNQKTNQNLKSKPRVIGMFLSVTFLAFFFSGLYLSELYACTVSN